MSLCKRHVARRIVLAPMRYSSQEVKKVILPFTDTTWRSQGERQADPFLLFFGSGGIYQGLRKAPCFSAGDVSSLVGVVTMHRNPWYNLPMKRSTSLRLTEAALHLLAAMAEADGISHTAMLEIAIREAARKRGIRADSGIQTESQPGPTSRD